MSTDDDLAPLLFYCPGLIGPLDPVPLDPDEKVSRRYRLPISSGIGEFLRRGLESQRFELRSQEIPGTCFDI